MKCSYCDVTVLLRCDFVFCLRLEHCFPFVIQIYVNVMGPVILNLKPDCCIEVEWSLKICRGLFTGTMERIVFLVN